MEDGHIHFEENTIPRTKSPGSNHAGDITS